MGSGGPALLVEDGADETTSRISGGGDEVVSTNDGGEDDGRASGESAVDVRTDVFS